MKPVNSFFMGSSLAPGRRVFEALASVLLTDTKPLWRLNLLPTSAQTPSITHSHVAEDYSWLRHVGLETELQ